MNFSDTWICLDVVTVDLIMPAVELGVSAGDDPN
jgi:hypothetical protein